MFNLKLGFIIRLKLNIDQSMAKLVRFLLLYDLQNVLVIFVRALFLALARAWEKVQVRGRLVCRDGAAGHRLNSIVLKSSKANIIYPSILLCVTCGILSPSTVIFSFPQLESEKVGPVVQLQNFTSRHFCWLISQTLPHNCDPVFRFQPCGISGVGRAGWAACPPAGRRRGCR